MAENTPHGMGIGPVADDEIEQAALNSVSVNSMGTMTPGDVATLVIPRAEQRPVSKEPKPVVIKGGPRRVVRADGRRPVTGKAVGQRKFALSSGHALFTRPKRPSKLLAALFGLVGIGAIVGMFYGAWTMSQAAITHDARTALVSSGSYDSAISLTPANDGGYYTVFFVTSTPTTEEKIGTLGEAFMLRTDLRPDKEFTGVVRANIPLNLAVSTYSTDNQTITVSLVDVLSMRGANRALSGIDAAYDTRLYNVIIISQEQYQQLASIIAGQTSAESYDPQNLLGNVRSNLSLEQIVEYVGRVYAVSGGNIATFDAPGNDVTSSTGEALLAGDPSLYQARLEGAITGVEPVVVNRDENGNPIGTFYDENGIAQLDDKGYPIGTIYAEDGVTPLVDEWNNVIIYGQQYDDRGNPVGTHYDEWGNMLYDDWGNPLGTQYDEWGNILRDFRGNMVIS